MVIDKESEICECDIVHKSVVERVNKLMPNEDVLYDAAELFKVFGDSTRTRILSGLVISEMCVCDIAELLKMTKSAVSHQLRVLRQTKLVKCRREGKEVYYMLADEHVEEILNTAFEHIRE
ncbi:MAG: metalloregulator ArsR/SmtB family transcription factor [Clostridia bacterium]